MKTTPLLSAALATALAGCATAPVPEIRRGADAGTVPEIRRAEGEVIAGGAATGGATMQPGTGRVINEALASQPPPALPQAGEATFNFEGESLHAVVKLILGDLLQQNYVIAPTVQGTVTLGTPRPVSPAQALALLEMVLGWNNARLIWSEGRYAVVPADQAVAGNLPLRTGSPAGARGLMAIEDQGSGTQYVRARTWPQWRPAALIPIAAFPAIAAIAFFQGAESVGAVMAGIALLVVVRTLSEASSAQLASMSSVDDHTPSANPAKSYGNDGNPFEYSLQDRTFPAFFEPGDAGALAARIRELYHAPARRRALAGAAGRRFERMRWSRTQSVYTDLVGRLAGAAA